MKNSLHDKLAKVLRLAEGATTEGERQAALARAQALVFRYNLDLSEINIEEQVQTKVGEHPVGSAEGEWQISLWNCLALANFCRMYYSGDKNRARVVVIGKKHNVEVVKSMYAYLQPQMEAEAMREVSRRGQLPRYALICILQHMVVTGRVDSLTRLLMLQQLNDEVYQKALKAAHEDLIPLLRGNAGLELITQYTGLTKSYASEIRPYIKRGEIAPEVVEDLKSWKYSFQRAMVHRVYERLMQERHRLEDEAGDSGHALVLREKQAADEYYDQLDLHDAAASSRRHDAAGYASGREAADRVSITQRETLGNVSGRELDA